MSKKSSKCRLVNDQIELAITANRILGQRHHQYILMILNKPEGSCKSPMNNIIRYVVQQLEQRMPAFDLHSFRWSLEVTRTASGIKVIGVTDQVDAFISSVKKAFFI